MILDYDRQPLIRALDTASAGILDGGAVAEAIREQLAPIVDQFSRRDVDPTLAVVQVGDDPASSLYIQHKQRASEAVGIDSRHHHLDGDADADELYGLIDRLNADSDVHGVLVQLPLPPHMRPSEVIHRVDPTKDVDGFHPVNLGCLATCRSLLEPCTPRGVMRLLETAGVNPAGREAVVVGRSLIVGRPMSMMLTRADATTTVCHRHTSNLAEVVSRADILVVATGVPELVQGDWIKDGAVVVDVGISRIDGSLVGDVDFDRAAERASWITPVPGGVGPMTVATLLENTLRACCIHEDYVVRNGELRTTDDAETHYHTVGGLNLTQLREGRRPGVADE